ncbi:DUF1269 domain-containing protein [Kutzneria albida]|uniref:Membrane protein of uknown function UCP014873 n=1 Tax=Kutzneria albida DSM 43870 TaxID=1449976 RepID=W5W5N7_9PSEU|nr:DUF1269 domain-containing protein [Kutzneria albida]AHH95781.1 hypothetical protein KALB_2413 [Kutzneria albida DSM 43870]
METLTIWQFDTADGASQAAQTLRSVERDKLITVRDAATVSWPSERKTPKTTQLHNLAGSGALGGAFWGMLFGLIFFVPLLGAAIGATAGALGGALSNVGIDRELIQRIRDRVTPGTSALFVLSSNAVLDKVGAAFAGQQKPELLFTNLSSEHEAALREVFGEHEPTPAADEQPASHP